MKLRDVLLRDLEFMHKLMNKPSVRAVSHNHEPFSYESHVKYWQDKINEPEFEAKIIENNDETIGLIRHDKGYISIAILPEYQNQGIGTAVLTLFCKKGDKAEIYPTNPNSLHTFEKAGFRIQYLILEYLILEKE